MRRSSRSILLLSVAALAALAAVAACGTGRTIVTIDILSFIKQQTLGDTLPYLIPGNAQGHQDYPPFSAPLLEGLSKSAVDSVQIYVAADIINYAGSGTVTFITFFGNDSATVYSSTRTDTSTGTVNGVDTLLVGHGFRTFARGNDTTFISKVWVGLRAAVDNPNAAAMNGRVQVGALQLRVYLKDKLF